MRWVGKPIASTPLILIEPRARAGQAHDGAQRRGAAGAIAAQQRDDFALGDRQIDVMQDVRFAIPGVQRFAFMIFRAAAVA